jgi:uncharacterized protein
VAKPQRDLPGRPKIVEFLTSKWDREVDYRLIKELWPTRAIVSRSGSRTNTTTIRERFRAYGNENWEFDENGLIRRRHASINDLPIRESEPKFHWDRSHPRSADHPGFTDLGL